MKLGAVNLTAVTQEELSYETDITDKPTESGLNISDNASLVPTPISINGIISGQYVERKQEVLLEYRDNSEVIVYSGINGIYDVIIKDLSIKSTSRVKNGFEFSMTLRQINQVQLDKVTVSIKKYVKKDTTSGAITVNNKKVADDKADLIARSIETKRDILEDPRVFDADSARYERQYNKYQEDRRKALLQEWKPVPEVNVFNPILSDFSLKSL